MENFFAQWGSLLGWAATVGGIVIFVYSLFFSDSEGRGKAADESNWQYSKGTGVFGGLVLIFIGLAVVFMSSK